MMENQAEIVKAMSHKNFYPCPTSMVKIIQTHISYIFVGDEDVYKVKKPVNFGFLDFTTKEKRRFYCEQEVILNRRLAPKFYEDVVAITRESSGAFTINGAGEVMEYAVHMKKIPTNMMLKNLLAQGKAGIAVLDKVAQRLAEFHRNAATNEKINKMGKLETIRFNHEENFAQTQPFIELTISPLAHRCIQNYVSTFLEKNEELLLSRVAQGKIRDCHGDLHIEHIICEDEEISIFDCIEFNDRFRHSDVAADVAFLAMDLDYNGFEDLSRSFVSSYIKHSADDAVLLLLNFYRCYYAFVRGKVISFRLNEKSLAATERVATAKLAGRYFDLALRYATALKKPTLIIICGLMGTGKSQMARTLTSMLGIDSVVMDVLRKELLNIPPHEKHYEAFSSGIYSAEMTKQVYDVAFAMAQKSLAAGKSIIIDASFKKQEMRLAVQRLAMELGADFLAIRCVCPDSIVEERLKRRALRSTGASDGRWEIYAEQKQNTDAFSHFSEDEFFTVDTSGNRQDSIFTALAEMAKRLL
ncbi:MAG: AAA family ATPase [Deltaproteobacteria bacterium]|nr:AAA family ATPase [Deltaproteobacteria bacterium]